MYFEHIFKKIGEINPKVRLKFKEVAKINTLEASSTSVPKIAVFDYDMNQVEFEKKVKICKETRIIYSNLNFDLWLLLHKQNYTKKVQDNGAYAKLIKSKYNLETSSSIKSKASMEKILKQIEIEDVKRAIAYSNNIMNNKLESDKIFVKRGFCYYENPSMNINEFFKELFEELNI